MKFYLYALLIMVTVFCSARWATPKPQMSLAPETPLWEVLTALGEPAPNHQLQDNMEGVSVERGERLVHYGITSKPSGGRTAIQSRHFVCTSCHNVEREDPDLSQLDPQARLEYTAEKGLPFLQATTLYGAVNRMQFYNDDYEKKYGDLVKPARNDLREAIQLCAIECSQGRRMTDWELESTLAYLWTLELKLSDLSLDKKEWSQLEKAMKSNDQNEKGKILSWLRTQYPQKSPAHFVAPPEDRKEGYPVKGQPANGKLIYDQSCLHCHDNQRYSFFNLDDSKLSFRYLKKHIGKYSHASLYQVTRYGVQPLYGRRAYMPQYPREKMTDQQLEDLRAYIEERAR